MARWVYLAPVVLFGVLAVALAIGLRLKPQEIPSALIDRPMPQLSLPAVEGLDVPGLLPGDFAGDKPIVLNVFASWCAPCRIEHAQLMALAARNDVTVLGLAYKDAPADTARFLEELGNPFAKVGRDADGRAAIELGVYGVPETFVVSPDGRILYKHISVITADDLEERFLPLIAEWQARS